MFRIYRAELMKLRHTKINIAVWIMVALGNLVPLLIGLSQASTKGDAVSASMQASMQDVFFQQGTLIMILEPFMFALITGYIFSKEYSEGTINQLFAYPVSRTRIFAAKLGVVFTMIIITSALSCVSVIGMGTFKAFAGEIPFELLLSGFVMNLVACALSFGTIPLAAAVSMAGKSVIPPMVLGAFASFVTLIIQFGRQDMKSVLFPWATPYYLVREFGPEFNGEVNPYVGTALIILLLTFLVSLTFCLWHYNKTEVHSGS
jgi:bacitracin transport system permease protein